MSDYVHGRIMVGGEIADAATLERVADLFVAHELRSEYDEPRYEGRGEAMLAAMDAAARGGWFEGHDPEAKGGRFYDVEAALEAMGVSYTAYADATDECAEETISFTPGTGHRERVSNDEDPTFTASEVRAAATAPDPAAALEAMLAGLPVEVDALSFPESVRAELEVLRRKGFDRDGTPASVIAALEVIAEDPARADLRAEVETALGAADPDAVREAVVREAGETFRDARDAPGVGPFVEHVLRSGTTTAAFVCFGRDDDRVREILSGPAFAPVTASPPTP